MSKDKCTTINCYSSCSVVSRKPEKIRAIPYDLFITYRKTTCLSMYAGRYILQPYGVVVRRDRRAGRCIPEPYGLVVRC